MHLPSPRRSTGDGDRHATAAGRDGVPGRGRGGTGTVVDHLAAGAVAGALGTVALNAATYADMAVRGRPPSSVPADAVAEMARRLGVHLARHGDDRTADNRRTGIGALLGYVTGVTIGAGWGLARFAVPRSRLLRSGLVLGAVAMVGANAGAVAAGTTDPRRWGIEGWLEDVVPHVCFGLVAARAFDRCEPR